MLEFKNPHFLYQSIIYDQNKLSLWYISLNSAEFVQGDLVSNTTSSSFSAFEFSLLVTVIHLDS